MKTYFWDKITWKTTLLSILPIIMGALCSALGDWNHRQKYFCPKLLILIIFLLFYELLVTHYCKNEVNQAKVNQLTKKENLTYKSIVRSMMLLYIDMTDGLHRISNKITKHAQIDLNIWSHDKACMTICRDIYSTALQFSLEGEDFGVSYVRLDENNNDIIRTVGFANSEQNPPKIFGLDRSISDSHGYYDTKLFSNNSSDIIVMDNSEEIYEHFEYDDKTNKRDKYSQYIGIPVYCQDKKKIGLLQVVAYKGSYFACSKDEIKNIAKKYLLLYAHSLAMIAKVEKGLLSMPSIKIEKD